MLFFPNFLFYSPERVPWLYVSIDPLHVTRGDCVTLTILVGNMFTWKNAALPKMRTLLYNAH